MILIPGRMTQDSMKFHHTTQKCKLLKSYELLISGIFHLIFLDQGCPQVTETTKGKTMDKGDPL